MENKQASLLVVSMGKALNGIPPSSCGRQVTGPSSIPVVMVSLMKDMQTEHELIDINKNKHTLFNCIFYDAAVVYRTNYAVFC